MIDPFTSFSGEEQSVEKEDHVENEDDTFIISNKEMGIRSTIDFQPESFNQYSSFPYQQKKNKKPIKPIQKINLIFMTTVGASHPQAMKIDLEHVG